MVYNMYYNSMYRPEDHYLNPCLVEAQVGVAILGAYEQVVETWALTAPKWVRHHPLRMFGVNVLFMSGDNVKSASSAEYLKIFPHWSERAGLPGSKIYHDPQNHTDLDQKVSPRITWHTNNPGELYAQYSVALLQATSAPKPADAYLVHPNLPEYDIAPSRQLRVIKLCQVLAQTNVTIEHIQPTDSSLSTGPAVYIAEVVPGLSRNVRLQGGEPRGYVNKLKTYLEELLEKTGDKFNESANCDKPRQLHNLGEEVRLTRLAFKENGFKIPDL